MDISSWIKQNKEPWTAYGMTKRTFYRHRKANTLPVLFPSPEDVICSTVGLENTPTDRDDKADDESVSSASTRRPEVFTLGKARMSVSSEREQVIREVLIKIAKRIQHTFSDVYPEDREAHIVMFLEVCSHEGMDDSFLESFFSKGERVRASALVDKTGMRSLLKLVARYITVINNSGGASFTAADSSSDISIMKQLFTVCRSVEFIEDLEKGELIDIARVISCLTFDQFRIVDDTMFCFTEGLWIKAKASGAQNPLKRYMTQTFPNTLDLVEKQIRKRTTTDGAQRDNDLRKADNVRESRKVAAVSFSHLYSLCRNNYATSDTFERELDTNDHLIASKNCVYDHNTGRARKGIASDMASITTGHTIPFDADGNLVFSKDFEDRNKRTVSILLGNHPSVEEGEHMLDVLAYATHGDRSKDAMGSLMFIYGKGGNGKSILTKFIEATFKGYAASCAKDVWTSTKNSANAPETELITFKGKRIIITQEIKGGVELQTELLKKITGGDMVTPREMYISHDESIRRHSYKGTQVILLFADQMPKIDTTGKGLSRRFLMHEFPFQFVGPELFDPKNKFHKLANNDDVKFLLKEPETATAFFMFLLRRYQTKLKPLFDNNEKIHVPQSLIDRTDKFIRFANDINNFVNTTLEECEGAFTTFGELLDLYRVQSGSSSMSSFVFKKMLETVLEIKTNETQQIKRPNGLPIKARTPYVEGYKMRADDNDHVGNEIFQGDDKLM